MKKTILVVDHDSEILSTIKSVFENTRYDVVTTSSALSALKLLKTLEINLIICNLDLPGISGWDLLHKVKEKYPDVIRIIMSETQGLSLVFRAIRQKIGKYYILKPLKEHELLENINQIVDAEDDLKDKDLLNLINHTEKLPTIEMSYKKILNMIDNDYEISEIATEIEKDFAISSKLLQVANSAFYGLKTGSVKRATVFLGLSNLKSLIYSTSILNSLEMVAEKNQQRVMDLWKHAVLTNKLLNYIYEEFLNKKIPEDACSAGLLHNIGTLILIYNRMRDYNSVMNKVNPSLANMLEMEKEAFRVTHQEAGGYLASFWELPLPIVEAALYHHRPFESKIINREIVYAVHLAQHYSWHLTKQPAVTELYTDIFDILEIDIDDFEAAINWNNWD